MRSALPRDFAAVAVLEGTGSMPYHGTGGLRRQPLHNVTLVAAPRLHRRVALREVSGPAPAGVLVSVAAESSPRRPIWTNIAVAPYAVVIAAAELLALAALIGGVLVGPDLAVFD